MRTLLATLLLVVTIPAYGATLSGRVTNTAGGGIHPIDIDVFSASTGLLVATPGDSTDANGNYSLTVPSGSYNVEFNPTAGSHWFRRTASVTVTLTATLNVTLARGHYLSGRITRPNGSGAPLVDLDFHDPATGDTPTNLQDDFTDANGFYTTLVDSAVWNVSYIAPLAERLVPVELLSIDLRADQNLGTRTLAAGHLVSGTVTDGGFFPVADADLDARPAGGGVKQFTPGDNTAADGSYAFILPPGTWDLSAGPTGSEALAPATARAVVVMSDVNAGNLVLPPGIELRGRCRDASSVAVAGVDVDVDSLPLIRRLEVQNDATDSAGNFRVLVSQWKFRVTLSPPVATKLLPVRFDSLQISGARDLGTITHQAGRWVSGTVTSSSTGLPVAGANLDFFSLPSGILAITPGDVTDGAGFFKVTLANGMYRLRVLPPNAATDTLIVEPVHIGQDTTLALVLPGTVDVPLGAVRGLELAAPWPNPSSGTVALSFIAPAGIANVDVVDITGRRVVNLYHGSTIGPVTVHWSGSDARNVRVPAGIYFVRLAHATGVATRAVVRMP